MTDMTYWDDDSLVVTGSEIVVEGVTHRLAEVSGAQVSSPPPDTRVYTRVLLGLPLALWGVLFLAFGSHPRIVWSTALGALLLLVGVAAIGSGVRVFIKDRKSKSVVIELEPDRHFAVTAPKDRAAAMVDAVNAAIADQARGGSSVG